ncbi:MAG: PQQ-binding-like beta-propeller repeat protein [Chloroflexi bacterium]|nr:PQQ-binding-like beta-propeller repeat protein [Chloroflexota bacterium]
MLRALFAALFLASSPIGWSAALASSPGSWPVPGHDAAGTGFNAAEHILSPANAGRLRRVWSVPAVIQAVATASRVYALTRGGTAASLLFLDARTGQILHSFTTRALGLPGGDDVESIGYGHGKLVVGATRTIVALDAQSGRPLWRAAGGATSLTIQGAAIYTGKGCQSYCGIQASYALDLASGRVLWRHNGNFGGPPALVAGRLYQVWGEVGEETRVYDPATGQLVARLPFGAGWTGDSSSAFAESSGGSGSAARLQRISATGRPAWTVRLGAIAGGTSPPVYAYRTLYTVSNRFHPGVIAVAAATGQIKWGADLGPSLILAGANHLLFALHRRTGTIDVLNAGSGALVVRLGVPGVGPPGQALLIANGTLYVIGGNGLTALRAS